VATPDIAEIRRLLHALREPLGAFVIHLELLDREELSVAGRSELKTMRANMERATKVFEDLDFVMENGHAEPKPPPIRRPVSTP
jgi:hypothetical protein